MATIELMIRDDLGNLINDKNKHIYQINLETDNFDSIEKALIRFKNQMLPDVHANLLEKQQKDFVQKKNNSLRCNGTMPVTIKTLHGKINFKLQRFIENNCDESQTTYFELTHQFREGYISCGLKEFSTYYSNRLSYEEVEALIERTTGQKQLSDQKIRTIVVDKAIEVSRQLESEVKKNLEDDTKTFPEINSKVDIYDGNTKEVLVFYDSILVKEQQETRVSKKAKIGVLKNEPKAQTRSKTWVNTHVVLLEKKTGDFEYITDVIDKNGEPFLPLAEVVKSKVKQEYGQETTALNVVAISDGAKNIRSLLKEVFGASVVIILDWYHLCKKIREFMSMIARNKEEKAEHLEFLLSHLWYGQTDEVENYLKNQVFAKNPEKLQKLREYIEKHQEEIINYDQRKKGGSVIGLNSEPEDGDEMVQNQASIESQAGAKVESEKVPNQASKDDQVVKKVLGSGRVEKACDCMIGNRQKHKGMSFRPLGSRSLGILKVAELNHKWKELWFPSIRTNNLQCAANDPSQTAGPIEFAA